MATHGSEPKADPLEMFRKQPVSADKTASAPPPDDPHRPPKPDTLEEAGISDALLESLVFKYLLAVGSSTGRAMTKELGLPGRPTLELLSALKSQQMVYYRDTAAMGDFKYMLTEAGRDRAKRYFEECTYVGPCPVPLAHYIELVERQTVATEHPDSSRLEYAFRDLLISRAMLDKLGPAINSGRGLFLYGYPGNGKTSIAERITASFGTHIWIPYAIFVDGEIIKFYDPECHQALEDDTPIVTMSDRYDLRWIRIKRPTVVAGGELTMEALELQYNTFSKITEPSLQLKSNGGTLVIDDFGRQRMRPDELLNRWIVPLEKRVDFLTLANGKKIQVPFDQLIIFSTNLEPRDLVDEAFLRRIPYKINVPDPSEEAFRKLMIMVSEGLGVAHNEDAVNYLIDTHYRKTERPFRCCHPRDLLLQIVNRATYVRDEPRMTPEAFDRAVDNYFAVF
ncbi:MAG TPA: AAA family ATPase [Phycisphaerae bacterium]|nr:AAA family ATPase [Phycisphaerae bacterium]